MTAVGVPGDELDQADTDARAELAAARRRIEALELELLEMDERVRRLKSMAADRDRMIAAMERQALGWREIAGTMLAALDSSREISRVARDRATDMWAAIAGADG